MYKEKISRYIDAHRKEMLEDIGALCRINSVKEKSRYWYISSKVC